MEKLHIDRPILVEGKYDKITLSSITDAPIIPLQGFGIFSQKEKQAMLRRLAGKNGVIVLCDPDGAGRVIRGFLSSILPKDKITHLYVPAVQGKEKRKTHAGKAGLLGVEGMDTACLRRLLTPFSSGAAEKNVKNPVTKTDFFLWGLSGGDNSKEKRAAFCRAADLPPEMSANALLEAVNLLYGKEECERILVKAAKNT